MVAAAETICAAVARYKELCEGRYKGARCACDVRRFASAVAVEWPLRGERSRYSCSMLSVLRNLPAPSCWSDVLLSSEFYSTGRIMSMLCAAHTGRTVTRLQTVDGTDFMYHPPPRQKMPSAATIAGAPINRCAQPGHPVGSPHECTLAHSSHGPGCLCNRHPASRLVAYCADFRPGPMMINIQAVPRQNLRRDPKTCPYAARAEAGLLFPVPTRSAAVSAGPRWFTAQSTAASPACESCRACWAAAAAAPSQLPPSHPASRAALASSRHSAAAAL